MFISLGAEGEGADRLSYILQKHPQKIFERGSAKLFFPVNEPQKVNAVFLVEFPEYKLWEAGTPNSECYVSSREYALSSLTCRELKSTLRSAITGNYKDEADRVAADKPLNLVIEALPIVTDLSDETIRDLFQPLGYFGFTRNLVVDHSYQHEWMPQKHKVFGLTVRTKKTVREVLRHLLVMLPVLDNYTHYSELDSLVEELKTYGEGWLDNHPMKDFIQRRFLRNSRRLIKEANKDALTNEAELEKNVKLGDLRTEWFVSKVQSLSARSVVDAGCGSGRLAEAFVKANILEVLAFDCHMNAVRKAEHYLKSKAQVFYASLLYRDDRLMNKDVFCLQEVIEHMPPFQLKRAMELIFKLYRPKHVLMSTPNREYNVNWQFKDGQKRHKDHKFEFNTPEADAFIQELAQTYGYMAEIDPIGLDYIPPAMSGASGVSDGAVAVAPRTTTTAIAPTFGFVFTRQDTK